ncbi:hypothetical protein HOU39_gp030 [Lactobacillus phage Iacchus]|uniref:Baseplate protein n=1 Tax=Lactobacillus phage Iacchus TaxID=2315483 RepID=A0A3Q8I190_9CAUD|nr:hypothetical protein HOU39_gp030 [Lactobacillus phage Iacchus]AYH91924.1 hypothetical protein [Lactobacillus phage Iacchus]
MSLLSFLHPLWKRSLNEYDDSVNSAVIGALNQSLSKSEEDMVQSKVESYLSTADAKWLDYWGYWFGERRKSGWSDDYYRSRIVNHVEHARGTVDALRDAIADFINTNKDNIYIYEPYRDMFIWNSSKYNTNKYFSSTYYRYAVIDIQISASYPKEIVSIINLFRPAGVLWVLTETVNSRNSDAPIIDIKNPKDAFVPKIENDFMFGLRKRTRLIINPSNDKYESVTNPFTYNKKDSLFNNRNSLFMGATQTSKRYSFVGQPLFDYTPTANDTLESSSYKVEQLSNPDITSISTKNGRGKTFDFNPVKDNLISNASDYINGVKLNSNTGNPNLALGTATPFTMTGNGSENNADYMYHLSRKIAKGTTVTVAFDITTQNPTGKYTFQFAGGLWQGVYPALPLVSGTHHQSYTIVTDNDYSDGVRLRLYNSTETVTVSNFIISESPTEVAWIPAPSEQTTSQSGSLVIPIANVNPDGVYSFSTVSMSDKDSSNASLNLVLKDKLGNDITSNITTSISSGKNILRINPKTSTNFSSNGYAVISFSGISNTDNISISLLCLKFSKSLDVTNRNLLTGTGSRTVTGTGLWVSGYLSNETTNDFISLFHGLEGETVTISVDYAYQGFVKGSSQNKIGWEVGIVTDSTTTYQGCWYYADSSTNSSGSGRMSHTFVVPENVTSISGSAKGWVEFSGSGTGTLSHLKLEKGSVATPWSPAPEDSIEGNTDNTNPISWAQSADEETNTPTKLADVIDLKGFINDNYKTLGTTITNKELNDLFDTKKLHLVIRTVNATSDSLTIRFFNFNTNLWVTYGKFDIAGSYTDIFVKLDDITPLMNAKSLMYASIEFSNDRSISVNLDYIGLSLSNSEDGYSVKMFSDQSPYGIESQSVMGPFTISKSSVSRAYISPSE